MVAAAVAAGAAVAGAASSVVASGQAAGASKAASQAQQQQYVMSRGDLLPYTQTGATILPSMLAQANAGPTGGGPDYLGQAAAAQPGQMTQAQLEATPGYQFTLSQNLKAVQASAAARGLGVSGAAMKGAATYATGLADSTYQNQFNNAQTRFQNLLNLNTGQQGNLTNQFNRMTSLATIGENAAAQSGAQGTQAANAAGNYLNQAGQATAAGSLGIGSAASQAAQNYLGYNTLQNLTGQTGGYSAAAQAQTAAIQPTDLGFYPT